MKKLFLSQPMKGKPNDIIKKERAEIIEKVKVSINEPFEIMDTVFDDFDGATPLKFLAKSIMVLADADVIYFADGWEDARGCVIEHECAIRYGLNIIHD